MRIAAATLISLALLCACSPEVGSERWCKQMSEKPKIEWSAKDTADYTQHCLFRRGKND